MSFSKTGDVKIEKVFCSCGTEMVDGVCPKCSKEVPKPKDTLSASREWGYIEQAKIKALGIPKDFLVEPDLAYRIATEKPHSGVSMGYACTTIICSVCGCGIAGTCDHAELTRPEGKDALIEYTVSLIDTK